MKSPADIDSVAVSRFWANAVNERRQKQAPLLLSEVPDGFSAKALAAASVSTMGLWLALDHDYTIHIHAQHGSQKEVARGQEPVVAEDIKAIMKQLPEAASVAEGVPPRAKSGARRLKVMVENDVFRYDVVFEVRRRVMVPVTVWKRRK